MSIRVFTFLCLSLVLLLATGTALAQGPTADQLKEWLTYPAVLYVMMLLGTVSSQLKQVNVGQQEGASVTLSTHIMRLREWVVLFISNSLAFAALITVDQLNFAGAIGIGFAINELIDLDPTSSRSNSLVK